MARKLLSLVVALSVVLSSMSFAFAADLSKLSTGITDETVKKAVVKLGALGMTDGVEDGTYAADRQLNRAEATAFIVRALGLDSAAKAAAGATSFSDVPATHWASGYINVAQGQGLVEGMGDGTFAPDTKFTYAQALTVLVRALGYKAEFLPGTWPGNYLAKAADKKITKNVTFSPDGMSTRGAFAVLLSNTLDTKVIEVSSYESATIKYAESDETLLAKKLEITKVEDKRFKANTRLGAGKDQVTILSAGDNSNFDGTTAHTFDVLPGVDVETALGAKVDFYVNDDNKIIHIEKSDKTSSAVYFDKIDKLMDVDDNGVFDAIKLKISGKQFSWNDSSDASNAVIGYFNGKDTEITKSNIATTLYNSNDFNQYGRFVVEGGKVVFVESYYIDSSNRNLMIKAVTDNNKIEYYNSKSDTTTTIYDVAGNNSGGAVVVINGVKSTLADVKPFDVMYWRQSTDGDSKTVLNVFVTRVTKTGKAGGARGDTVDAVTLELAGSYYEIQGDGASYSKDTNATFESISAKTSSSATSSTTEAEKLEDFYGADVTLIMGWDSKWRHLVGSVNTTSGEMFGVIKKYSDMKSESETVKIYNNKGESVTYSFEDTDSIGKDAAGSSITSMSGFMTAVSADSTLRLYEDAYIVRYKLTKDGKIAKNTVQLYSTATYLTQRDDFGDTTILYGTDSTAYVDSKNAAVFDISKTLNSDNSYNSTDDFNVAGWSTLSGKDYDSGSAIKMVVIYKDGTTDGSKDIEAIFILSGEAGSDTTAAYVVDVANRDGDDYARLHVLGETADKWVQLSSNRTTATSADIATYRQSVRPIKMMSGNKVSIRGTDADFSYVGGKVYKIDGQKIYIGSSSSIYTVATNAVVWSGDSKKDFSNIQQDDMVVGLLHKGVIESLEWNASDTSSSSKAVKVLMTKESGSWKFFSLSSTLNTWTVDTGWTIDANNIFDNRTGYKTYKNKDATTGYAYLGGTGTKYMATIWKSVDELKVKSISIETTAP